MNLLEEPSSILRDLANRLTHKEQRPKAILAMTYTFNPEYWEHILDVISEACSTDKNFVERRDLKRIPVDVVCDSAQYRGHPADRGYNVHVWRGARLFHPKCLLILLEHEILWIDGSLNLTRCGWCTNREIAMLHDPGNKALPRELRQLLEAARDCPAAKTIVDTTVNAHNSLPGRLFTSLAQPIGPRFLRLAPKSAREIHLLAPFFDCGDQGDGETVDGVWLQKLADEYQSTSFHIYVPQLDTNPLTVQGTRTVFAALASKLDPGVELFFHPVVPKPGHLHGKLIAIRFKQGRKQRARILMGSANITSAALLKNKRNVEMAWIFEASWSDTEQFLKTLGTKRVGFRDLRFRAPARVVFHRWNALERAQFDPVKKELHISWANGFGPFNTDIEYLGKRIKFSPAGASKPFALKTSATLKLISRAQGNKISYFPIEIAGDVHSLMDFDDGTLEDRRPEDWLRLLGGLPVTRDGQRSEKKRSGIHRTVLHEKNTFQASERIRDLMERLRTAESMLIQEAWSEKDRRWIFVILKNIVAAYAYDKKLEAQENVWHFWVRFEIWNLARRMSTNTAVGKLSRQDLHKLANSWRRGLISNVLPAQVQKQALLLIQNSNG